MTVTDRRHITVLVTGAGGGVGEGVIKALRMMRETSPVDVKIVAADMSHWAAGLYAGDVAVRVPKASAPGYVDAIVDICRRERVDYYLPGTDVELVLCADNADKIRAEACGAKTVIAPAHAVRIADDKRATARFLADNGFAYPKTFLRSEWTAGAQLLPLPLVVKPRIGCRSIGMEVVRDAAALDRALSRDDDIVLQELVGDDDSEYTCTVVSWHGEQSDVVVLRRWLRSGDTYRVEPLRHERIEQYVAAVAGALKIEGSSNFQLRLDQDGQPKLFEVNARFSGTTPLCSQLGFNPVASYLLRDLGVDYRPQLRTDAVILRHWAELVVDRATFDEMRRDGRVEPARRGGVLRTML